MVMLSVAGAAEAMVRLRLTDLLCAGLFESETVNMRAPELTAAVGVPLMAPVDAFNASPAGSVPLVKDHV